MLGVDCMFKLGNVQQPATRKVGCHTRCTVTPGVVPSSSCTRRELSTRHMSQQRLAYSSREELRNKMLSQCYQSEGGRWARIVSFSNDTMKCCCVFTCLVSAWTRNKGLLKCSICYNRKTKPLHILSRYPCGPIDVKNRTFLWM